MSATAPAERLDGLPRGRRLVVVLGYSPRSGGGLHPICESRLAHAAALAREGDVVLLSGWARRGRADAEADLMARAWPGSRERLLLDRGARHTVGNAASVAAAARSLGSSEVVVVTSAWHRPRATLLVRRALGAGGPPVTGLAAPSPGPLSLRLRELACLAALPLQLAGLRRLRG